MESIQVEKTTKDRLIKLGGAGSVDETIRCLLEQSNRLDPKLLEKVDFERATEIAANFLREYGHPHPKLDTTLPYITGGWDFHFDVGVVSKKILVIRVNKEGKIVRIEPSSEIYP